MKEKELLDGLRCGEMGALEAAIEEYSGYVAAVVRHTLSPTPRNEDVEELVSDVFLSLWQHAARLAPNSRLKPWLAVVARNSALNWARNRSRRPLEASHDQAVGPAAASQPDPLDSLAKNGLIMEALGALDDENRRLVVSHYLEDRSISEIARMTSYSEPAVKSRLFRSRSTIRRHLKQEGLTS
jgi:RNA polymerase sigma-70 factor (ECF subfamily)